jgi:hypothetical protein
LFYSRTLFAAGCKRYRLREQIETRTQ